MAERSLHTNGSLTSSYSGTSSSIPERNGFDIDMDNTGFSGVHSVATVRNVHKKKHPLQHEADRLGKQVEDFAEALERFGSKIYEEPRVDCAQVLPLIKEYETIAKKTVARLREIRDPDGQRQQESERERGLRRPPSNEILGTTAEDLRWWEQEQRTWNLLGRIIQVEYPSKQANPTQPRTGVVPRPRKDAEVHCYSLEQTLWQNFLAEDDNSWERHLVLEWLKCSADELNPAVEDVIERSVHASLRGRKVGSKGWEASKGLIKSQKRLRSWPTTLDPNSPGIDKFNLKTSNSSSLVTQLDPDAITRQGRVIDSQDNEYEHATWIACWEMLRRGKSWSQIRAWCKERTDIWRAVSIRGELQLLNVLGEEPGASNQDWQSRSLWRQVCVVAAMDGGLDDFERAVYGLVSGYLPSVLKVCHSWDDYLFAHYNSYLHHQFEAYLYSHFPERQASLLFKSKLDMDTTLLGGTSILSGKQIMDKMQRSESIRDEFSDPLKMVQAGLIARQFSKSIHRLGQNLVQSLHTDTSLDDEERENNLRIMYHERHRVEKTSNEDDVFTITVHDNNMLRLLTHIQLIFQTLDPTATTTAQQSSSVENVFVAYGEFLAKAGKQTLLPLYASKMSFDTRLNFLALKLPDILDTAQRQTTLTLLNHYDIDVLDVLDAQLRLLVTPRPKSGARRKQDTKLRILQDIPSKGYGGVRLLKASFLIPSETRQPIDLIHGFEWLNMLEGNWKRTLSTGVVLYQYFIRSGEFSAGRQLAKTVPFSHISLRKTPGILGYEVDLSQHGAYDPSETNDHMHEESDIEIENGEATDGRRTTGSWLEQDVLVQSAALFRDLESLFLALDALENWAQLAAEVDTVGKDVAKSKIWRGQMKDVQHLLDDAMNPIWSSDWLRSSEQDSGSPYIPQSRLRSIESSPHLYTHTLLSSLEYIHLNHGELDKRSGENLAIRDQFLPELLIAYVSAINFYGHAVSRDYMVECMDLVAFVADEAKGKHIVETLMRAGRMVEFVELVTRASREMVGANEMVLKGSQKRKKSSQKMALWSVKAPAA